MKKHLALKSLLESVWGILILVAPSLLCLFFVVVCKRSIWLWLAPTIALIVAIFLRVQEHSESEASLTGMLMFICMLVYIGGGYKVCLSVINRKSIFGEAESDGSPDSPLTHMTGEEDGGVDTTGLLP